MPQDIYGWLCAAAIVAFSLPLVFLDRRKRPEGYTASVRVPFSKLPEGRLTMPTTSAISSQARMARSS
jgi:hypothetical protein